MRHLTVFIVYFMLVGACIAQKPRYNHNMLFGNTENGGIISFQEGVDTVSFIPIEDGLATNLSTTTISMSDREGNLVFYSEGCRIYDMNHQAVEGSEELKIADADIWDLWCETQDYRIHMKNMIAVPMMEEGYEDMYHLIHYRARLSPKKILKDSIFYSVVKVEDGMVTLQDMNQFVDVGDFSSTTTEFVRAGDQNSWWMLQSMIGQDSMRVYLIDHTGMRYHRTQQMGNFSKVSWFNERYSRSAMAPDGSKYVRMYYPELIYYDFNTPEVLYFDRDEGVFTGSEEMRAEKDVDPSTWRSMAFTGDSKATYHFIGRSTLRNAYLADSVFTDYFATPYRLPREDVGYTNSEPSYAVVRGPDCRFYMPSFIPDNVMLILEEVLPRKYEKYFGFTYPPYVDEFDVIYSLPFNHNFQAPYMPEIYTGTIYEGVCEEYELTLDKLPQWSRMRGTDSEDNDKMPQLEGEGFR